MAWVFTPYKGLSDIRFRQDREEVERVLGEPQKVKRTYTGKTRLEYSMSMPAFVFADGELIEMNLLPDVSEPFEYRGMDLFAMPEDEVLRQLEQDDLNVRESNGFIIFFGLGLALTGFHDEMPEQKAITLFGHNHPWIEKRPTMQASSFL
ncbi:hypothetical protein EPK99_04130 [Neorhizobium lilium]|uniref:Uncharacterized protein n=1 Tax=Neorhizobium lilium TaxID=2503024 RepID=A0A444LMD7_9HYPH|nr:hypothetical protein [Neorhizobium lilium]RWX81485.1 hypothetical protein EPK99_04130 [Neorhizobium lilium]